MSEEAPAAQEPSQSQPVADPPPQLLTPPVPPPRTGRPKVELEQKIDIRRIGPTKWRLILTVGQAIAFYGEAGAEEANFTVANQFAPGDVGQWRAVDARRRLIIGHGGRATVTPREGAASKGDVTVNFQGVALAI